MFSFPNSKICGHVLPILSIFLVVVVYTWPLLGQLTNVIPGRFELTDTTETVWSIGWVHQALFRGESVWHTDRLFVPYGADLRFNVFGLLQGLMALPFVRLLGVAGASNLIIILTMFLNGMFAYFLVNDHIQHSASSLLASVSHILSIAVVWHFTIGRNGLPTLWVISASLLCLKALLDEPTIWRGFLLGLLLLAAFFTDLQVVTFTWMWILTYFGVWLWKNSFMNLSRTHLVSILVAISMSASAFGLVLGSVIPNLSQSDFHHPSLDDAAYYAFSIKDFVSLQTIPYIYGFDFLIAVILAVILFKWRGEYRFWLFVSLIFLMLSLGPYLKPTHIPLPYSIVSVWAPLQNFRAVYRFVIPATIGFTLVTGYVLKELLSKIQAQKFMLLSCAIFIVFRVLYTVKAEPFKIQAYPRYVFYEQISAESEDYTILEIPFGIRSGLDQIGEGGERLQYYQPIHGKRILNGSLARLPASLFAYYRNHPSLMFFSGDLSVDRGTSGNDFLDVLGWAKPRYVLVHRSLISIEQSREIELFLDNQPSLQRLGIEEDLVIYKVIQ